MNFPEQFIERGEFELHSGGKTDKKYDINAMLCDPEWFDNIISEVPRINDVYVGIATAGSIIASHFRPYRAVKDGKFKGSPINGASYVLIDDVCTTEGSLREAINAIGSDPAEIFVVVDRRPLNQRRLKLDAMFDLPEAIR